MFSKDQAPRLVTLKEFGDIANLRFHDVYSLYRENKIPIVRQDGAALVDLDQVAALRLAQNDEAE